MSGDLSAQTPAGAKPDSCQSYYLFYGQATENEYLIKTSTQGNNSLIRSLKDNLFYLAGETDFYGIMGIITIPPLILKSDLNKESLALNRSLGKSAFAEDFFEIGEYTGSSLIHLPASLIIYAISYKSPESKYKSFALDLFSAQVINNVATTSLKRIINRTRPNGEPYGYPSGHASTAFTSAGVMYNHFGPEWGLLAYAGAAYTGLSRLQENKHYFSDIFAGAILGTYIAYKVTHRKDNNNSYVIRPLFIKSSPGLIITFKF